MHFQVLRKRYRIFIRRGFFILSTFVPGVNIFLGAVIPFDFFEDRYVGKLIWYISENWFFFARKIWREFFEHLNIEFDFQDNELDVLTYIALFLPVLIRSIFWKSRVGENTEIVLQNKTRKISRFFLLSIYHKALTGDANISSDNIGIKEIHAKTHVYYLIFSCLVIFSSSNLWLPFVDAVQFLLTLLTAAMLYITRLSTWLFCFVAYLIWKPIGILVILIYVCLSFSRAINLEGTLSGALIFILTLIMACITYKRSYQVILISNWIVFLLFFSIASITLEDSVRWILDNPYIHGIFELV